MIHSKEAAGWHISTKKQDESGGIGYGSQLKRRGFPWEARHLEQNGAPPFWLFSKICG
ncbi:hypothetical protein N9Z14_08250 [Opitutales bacterium]|nr:hypothetical protein [Opitutales bacterium]